MGVVVIDVGGVDVDGLLMGGWADGVANGERQGWATEMMQTT